MKVYDLIQDVKKYRIDNVPIEINIGMMVENEWVEAGDAFYCHKQRAEILIKRGHARALDPQAFMPEYFYYTECDDEGELVNIDSTVFEGAFPPVLPRKKAEYMQRERMVLIKEYMQAEEEVSPPEKQQELELTTIDNEVETQVAKKTRRKSAKKTNSSSSSTSRKRGRPKKPSQN